MRRLMRGFDRVDRIPVKRNAPERWPAHSPRVAGMMPPYENFARMMVERIDHDWRVAVLFAKRPIAQEKGTSTDGFLSAHFGNDKIRCQAFRCGLLVARIDMAYQLAHHALPPRLAAELPDRKVSHPAATLITPRQNELLLNVNVSCN